MKGDPTEGALVVAAAKAGMAKAELDRTYPRLDEIPFTSETKRMTTLHQMPEGVMAFSKGAPEIILEDCTQQMTADGVRPLDAADRARLLETAQEMAGQALRVLAVAAKPETIIGQAEKGMTYLGMLGMIDPPRPEAKAAIATCNEAGIKAVSYTHLDVYKRQA